MRPLELRPQPEAHEEKSEVRKTPRKEFLTSQTTEQQDEKALEILAHEYEDKHASESLRSQIAGYGSKKELLETRSPSFVQKLFQSRMFKAGIVAAGLHAPFTPQGQRIIDTIVHGVEGVKGEGMVLRPQSPEEMFKVSAAKEKREQRIDHAKLDAYKRQTRERMERGEEPDLLDEYFDSETLNGVDTEKVEQAKAKAKERIQKYSNEFGQDLSEPNVKRFVSEMYGPDSNYVWGQASVSEYFESGKRNCVAISKAELIVMEGVIKRLPEHERGKYHLGLSKQNRHDVATMTVDTGGGHFKTMYLEGGVRTIQDQTELVGTKTVPLNVLKLGMASDKPIEMAAKTGKFDKPPALIAVSDQPVSDGIVITGETTRSSYVDEQAEKQGVKAEPLKEVLANQTIELELLPGSTTVEEMKSDLKNQLTHSVEIGNTFFLNIKTPSVEVVKAMNYELADKTTQFSNGLVINDLKDWDAASVRELMDSPLQDFSIVHEWTQGPQSSGKFDASLKKVADALETMDAEGVPVLLKKISLTSHDPGEAGTYHAVPKSADTILRHAKDAEVSFDYDFVYEDDIEAIVSSPAKSIKLTNLFVVQGPEGGAIPDDNTLKKLNTAHAEIFMNGTVYLNQASQNPGLLKLKKIHPDFSSMSVEDLGNWLAGSPHANDPRLKDLADKVQIEIGQRANSVM